MTLRFVRLTTVLLGVLLSVSVTTHAQQASFNGFLYASQFAQWSMTSGADGGFSWAGPCVVTTGGVQIHPFIVGTPVSIRDSNPAQNETVIPATVRSTNIGCAVSFSPAPTYTHFSYQIVSATAGLQESINYAERYSAVSSTPTSVIILSPEWTTEGGTTGMITSASGTTAISILDQRTAACQYYTWNGSAYVAQSCGGGGTPGTPLNSVQYNCSGEFCGNGQFIVDQTGAYLPEAFVVAIGTDVGDYGDAGLFIAGNSTASDNVSISGGLLSPTRGDSGSTIEAYSYNSNFPGNVEAATITAEDFAGYSATGLDVTVRSAAPSSPESNSLTAYLATFAPEQGLAGSLSGFECQGTPAGVDAGTDACFYAQDITDGGAYPNAFSIFTNGGREVFSGDFVLQPHESQATCGAPNQGRFHYIDGSGASADTFEACMNIGSSTYAWVPFSGGGGGGGTPGVPLYSVQTNYPLGTFNGAADLLDETPILGPLIFTGDGLDFETADTGTATIPEYNFTVIENGVSADGCPACLTLQAADNIQDGGSMYVSTYGQTGGGSFQLTSASPSAADEAPAGGPGMIYLRSQTNAQGDGFAAAQIDFDAETFDTSVGSQAGLANILLTTCENGNPVGTLSCDISLTANPLGVGDGYSGLVQLTGTETYIKQSAFLPAGITSSTALEVAGGYSLPPGGIGEGQAASVVVDYGASAFVGYAYGLVIDTPEEGTAGFTDNTEASLVIKDPTADGDAYADAMYILGGRSYYIGNAGILVEDSAATIQGAGIVVNPYTTDGAAILYGETYVQPQAATPDGVALYAEAYGSEFAALFQGPVEVEGGGLTIQGQAFASLPVSPSFGETHSTLANTNIIGATITAAGSYQVQAFWNGANWVVAAGGVAAGVSLAATTPSIGGGLLAAGCTNQAAVTVPGALTTMTCAMTGTAGNPANLQPQCSVSAADTVIPQLCTAFGITPAAQTYNIRVF